MILPPFLQAGDRIGIIAPARKVQRGEATKAAAIFQSWGLEPVFGKNLFGEDHQFSGTDEERAQDLHSFLMDDSIKAIISFRGGYGSVRLMPHLADSYPTPKWLIGYSDFTVIHTWANQRLGWASIHATMPVNMVMEGEYRQLSNLSLKNALFGKPESLPIPFHTLEKKGESKGQLCGGNLSVLFSLLGSNLQLETQEKLLFLEDLYEYLYHVDRMMQAIKRARILDAAKAIVVGGMSDMRDNAIPFGHSAEEIIASTCSDLNKPLRYGLESGHLPLNRALIFGLDYELKEDLLRPLL